MVASRFSIRPWLAAACSVALLACGGGGDDSPATAPAEGEGPAPASRLYIGYYAEDPVGNPEDPTVGVLMFRAPVGDGSFAGQMPFSYVGCTAGVDTGAISGTRSGGTLSGQWSGVMDGRVAVGGALQATHDSASDSFTGNFSNAAGKVEVSDGGCRYFIAASGSFQAWGAQAQQPADFSLTASDTTTTPTLRWTARPTGTRYTVRVFDHACVQADPADVACFLGESFATTALASDYPADFLAGAATLQVGREYLAIVTAQDPATSAFTGFASLLFTPTRVADPDAGGGTGGGSDDGGSDSGGALGSLTITGASMGERFAPSSTPQGTVHINATGPTFTANTGLYGSGLTLTWEERDVLGGVSRAVQLFLSSVTSQAPGATPGEGVTVAAATYSQLLPTAQQASYHRQCGEPASILVACPAVGLLGVQWDLAARTVRFTDTVLPSTGPAAQTVVLNGTLKY